MVDVVVDLGGDPGDSGEIGEGSKGSNGEEGAKTSPPVRSNCSKVGSVDNLIFVVVGREEDEEEEEEGVLEERGAIERGDLLVWLLI